MQHNPSQHKHIVSLCFVVLYDEIMFVCLYLIAYSHLISSIRVSQIYSKGKECEIFYFCVFNDLCKFTLSNTEKSWANCIAQGWLG